MRSLFATLEPESYVISDFSLHSIGVILTRMDRHDLLLEFIDDLIVETGMRVMGVPSPDLAEVVALILRHHLDFDDAYRTGRGRTVLAAPGQLRPALRRYANRATSSRLSVSSVEPAEPPGTAGSGLSAFDGPPLSHSPHGTVEGAVDLRREKDVRESDDDVEDDLPRAADGHDDGGHAAPARQRCRGGSAGRRYRVSTAWYL